MLLRRDAQSYIWVHPHLIMQQSNKPFIHAEREMPFCITSGKIGVSFSLTSQRDWNMGGIIRVVKNALRMSCDMEKMSHNAPQPMIREKREVKREWNCLIQTVHESKNHFLIFKFLLIIFIVRWEPEGH